MAKQDFVPGADDEYDSWCDTFRNKIATVIVAVGIVPTTADAALSKIVTQKTAFGAANDAKADAQNKNQTFREKRTDTETEIRSAVKQIKARKEYTPAIGEIAGLEGPEESIDLKPKGKAKIDGGHAYVYSNKPNGVSGSQIFSKRGNETAFSLIGFDVHFPYLDNRPKLQASDPEKRTYYLMFQKDGVPVGEQSDEFTAIVP